ncbi:hypothetical protein AHiyo8_43920 [Arthrobacter sp. Hiyo8]|nr:hypothetical protein AHiyo8_43920 [Arthrobacter sp. Hiyo8]
MMNCARSVPCSLINASKDSTHSAVSSGSRSGSWEVNPLRMCEVSSPAATSNLSSLNVWALALWCALNRA